MNFKPGDRVYYRNNGPSDAGTVLDVNQDKTEVLVDFDVDDTWPVPSWYSPMDLAHVDG